MLGAVAAGSWAGQVEPDPVVLTDRTEEANLAVMHTPDALAIPLLHEWYTGGMAVGDFNHDGFPDLFWTGGGGIPDKLFINDGTGVFTDEAAAWGIADPHCGAGVTAGDYNGDGFVDLYVSSYGTPGDIGPGKNRLYRNDGGSGFTDVAVEAGVNFTSPTVANGMGAAFGDYDLDGDLDLFVTSHTTLGGQNPQSDGNHLYCNNGDGTFTDASAAAGIAEAIDNVRGFQPSFVDMNGDLYPELLLVADFNTSRYFVNNGDGTFTDFTAGSGTGVDDNGMGQCVADLDNDGLLDWYVTSVHLEREYSPNTPGTGNMLYLGQGDHLFVEDAIARGVNDGGWGWAAIAVDLDHDGWQELLEVNGWPANEAFINEPARLFYNDGTGHFTDIAADAGFDSDHDGRSMVWLDADRDGDLDVAVGNLAGPLQYFRNDGAEGHWLHVSLNTSLNDLLAPNGFGSRVKVTAGGQSQMRYLNGSPSFLATSEFAAHFGLGSAAIVNELRIEWARGQVTVLTNVTADQHVTVWAPVLGDATGDGLIDVDDFLYLLGHWGQVDETADLVVDVNADGTVGIDDFLYLLGNWDDGPF